MTVRSHPSPRLALVLLLAGSAVGCLVHDAWVRRADAAPPSVRWEYRCQSDGDLTSLDDLVGALNRAGAEGWELVVTGNRTSTTSHYCLKRAY